MYQLILTYQHLFHRFVQFNTQAEADAAIDQFNNFEVDGKTLRVMSDQKASNTGGSGFQGGFSSQNGESSARRPWGSGGHLNANGDGGSQDRFSGSDRVQVKVMNIPISLNKVCIFTSLLLLRSAQSQSYHICVNRGWGRGIINWQTEI